MIDLKNKHCIPCEGTEKPFDEEKIKAYKPALSLSWEVIEHKKLSFQFKFKGFPEAVLFVDRIVPIAESEGHHPDIHIFYNKVLIELWTHAIGGLSENDFIMALKIEGLVPHQPNVNA